MRPFFTFVFFFCLVAFHSFAMAEPLDTRRTPVRMSLKECIDMALRNNDQIRAAGYDIQASEARAIEAHPRGIPVIKYNHRLAPVPEDIDDPADSFFGGDITVFNNFKVEMGSVLTTFGKLKTAQSLADLGIDASWFLRQKKADEIVFKVYQIYHGIILARELLSLAAQAQNAIDGKIGELEKEKVQDQLQILKLKVALYEVERKMEEARKKEKLAIAALKLQMGFEDDINFNIKGGSVSPVPFNLKPLTFYVSEAKEYLPEFKLLDTGVRAKEQQLRVEKLRPTPNLGVGAFVDIGRAPNLRGAEDENNFTNPFNYTKAGVGFELKGELDYVKTKSGVRKAEAELLKTIYEKRAAIRGLELDIQKSYLDLQEAQSLMKKSGNEKKAARQMVFLTKSNLDIGLGEKKDYLDALQSYLVFQGREYEAIYNYNVAVGELQKKIGRLYGEQRKEKQ